MNVLARLQSVRLDRGLSQRDLAALAGVAQSTIAHLEAGKPARPTTQRKLAAALKVRPGALRAPADPTD